MLDTPTSYAAWRKEQGWKGNRQYISKLIKNNDYRVVMVGDKIDRKKTDELLYSPPSIEKEKPEPVKTEKKSGKKTESSEPETPFDPNKKLTIADSRATIEKHKAFHASEKDRIKNGKEEKTLVNFDKVAEKVFNFLRPLRDDMLDVSKRVSPIVYQTGSKREAGKVINDEINRILISKVGEDYNFDNDLKKKIIKVLMT